MSIVIGRLNTYTLTPQIMYQNRHICTFSVLSKKKFFLFFCFCFLHVHFECCVHIKFFSAQFIDMLLCVVELRKIELSAYVRFFFTYLWTVLCASILCFLIIRATKLNDAYSEFTTIIHSNWQALCLFFIFSNKGNLKLTKFNRFVFCFCLVFGALWTKHKCSCKSFSSCTSFFSFLFFA